MPRKLSGSEVRSTFLRYFEQHGHKIVHSSSLVPANDPTLLFTNAGMNQFKDVFLGIEKRDYSRATSSQKCVRAGGKHNDLENVGFTNRHHTFFEMLGNFSFGDYFKKDAIAYAWELCHLARVVRPRQEQALRDHLQGRAGHRARRRSLRSLARTRALSKERIYEMGMKDNFWQMGDTGPCGPCSELHYDMGVEASDAGHTDCEFGCECGRYVEIWNLVFMQFDRQPDGEMRPLPKPSIDTGAGLERVAAVMQGVISNYDTDLFMPLIKRAAELTGVKVDQEKKKEDVEQSAQAGGVAARHRRPRARVNVPHLRWRAAGERRPRLRAAQDHPPRDSSRKIAGTGEAVSVRDGVRRARPDERCVSGVGRERRSRRGDDQGRGDAICAHVGSRLQGLRGC